MFVSGGDDGPFIEDHLLVVSGGDDGPFVEDHCLFQEVMMDHSLRTISYIADIGEILVVMARRGPVVSTGADGRIHQKRQSKVCCHVFESEEVSVLMFSLLLFPWFSYHPG